MPSSSAPSKNLEPLLHIQLAMPENLPVNVFSSYLQKQAPKAPRTSIQAIANSYQMDLEQARDGDRFQELFGFYIAPGLPVYVGQLGLPGTDEDFLVAARALIVPSCASPFGLSLADWQIAGRKIWNWGEKRLHIRNAGVVADELLEAPDVRAAIPAMKDLPSQRIAVIGHSFTGVSIRFCSHRNRGVRTRKFSRRVPSSRAYENFYRDALAWKPGAGLLVLVNRSPQDILDLKTMAEGFRAANIRVFLFDDVLDTNDSPPANHCP